MPQFRPQRPPDPQVVADRMRSEVHDGVPDTTIHLSASKQIERLGADETLQAAIKAGQARSPRTVRRWRQQGRIPDPNIAALVQRADQVKRWGGEAEAAKKLGISEQNVREYLDNPGHQLPPAAVSAADRADRHDKRSKAGIPVDRNGRLARLPRLKASGTVWVKGDTDSETYEAHRNVDILLDEDTAEAILTAAELGDYDAAREAAEEYLSTHHAGCNGYGDDMGWHFEDLDSFDLEW